MSLREKQRKTNWLNEMLAIVIAGIVQVGAFGLFEILSVAMGKAPVTVTVPVRSTIAGQNVEQVSAELRLLDPTPEQVRWYLVTVVPTMLVLLAALGMLLRLLIRARRANPFTRATVVGLRWIAVVLIAGGALASIVEAAAKMVLSTTVEADATGSIWNIPVLWILVGAGCLAVSELVARGCDMREELDGLV